VGSTHVLHLHGEVLKARSTRDRSLVHHLGDRDIELGDMCELGSQLRPHIVWFGEMVPAMDEAVELVAEADVLIVVGTSLQVYLAAGLVFEAPRRARRIVVNPEVPDGVGGAGSEIVAKPATMGVPEVVADLLAAAGAPVAIPPAAASREGAGTPGRPGRDGRRKPAGPSSSCRGG
jgi:NAD-dependent deacetylase